MSESVIFCEGYHDRAFWAGWLTSLGCSSDGFEPNTIGYPAVDPWGRKVERGQFAFRSPAGQFLRIVPCGGKDKVLRAARVRLKERVRLTLNRLVLNIDSDLPAGPPTSTVTGLTRANVLAEVQQFDSAAVLLPNDEISLDAAATFVALIRWEVSDPPADGLPNQQSLERLICAAIRAAYPARADAVHRWLTTRPTPPAVSPKDHSWSYMAGWYAENGCDDFFRHVWRDPATAAELRNRLSQTNAWHVASSLAT